MNFDSYTRRAEAFLTRLNRELLALRSGRKDSLSLKQIYEADEELFSDEKLHELKQAWASSTGGQAKRRRHVLGFFTTHALGRAVLDQDESIGRHEASATLDVDGRSISLQKATLLVANEEDRAVREAIYRERRKRVLEANPVRLERWNRLHQRARELFGTSYLEVYASLHQLHVQTLRVQFENFLSASEAWYVSRLEAYAREFLGISAASLEPWDVPRLLRGASYDAFFPEGKSLSVLKRTLLGMGIDLKKLDNVLIDVEERPGKFTLPFSLGEHVPDRVHLVIRPHGGVLDYLVLLHEAGHALKMAFTDGELAFEYKALGDGAVGETFGFLLQYLSLNEEWLTDMLRCGPESGFREWNQFRKLYQLRRWAVQFLYELDFHGTDGLDGDALQERYERLFGEALHVPPSRADFLRDVDDGLRAADFLRAWVFEAELRQILDDRFGSRWYSRPSAGDFLRGLWAFGNRYGVEEMAPRVRHSSLDFGPITRELGTKESR